MIRVSIVSSKDILKNIFKSIIVIIVLVISFILYKIIFKYEQNNINISTFFQKYCLSCLKSELIELKICDNNFKNVSCDKVFIETEDILNSEIKYAKQVSSRYSDSINGVNFEGLDNVDYNEDDSSNKNVIVNKQEGKNEEILEEENEKVEEVINSGVKNTYNFKVGSVFIKNETSFNLGSMNLSIDKKFKNKNVLIFHTHTCESYTQTEKNKYVPSGNYRTLDLNYSVSKVGDELVKYLSNYGFNCRHEKSIHDYPAYSGSYGRSLKTVSSFLSQNKDFNFIIDLHRDAIGDDKYAPKVKIGNEYAAQIMFVIGTNGSGLKHDNWKSNLEYAIKIQEKANEMYPGLFKPILVRNARYNQHLAEAACIIEFGATGNTLEECEVSAKYLAKVLNEVNK